MLVKLQRVCRARPKTYGVFARKPAVSAGRTRGAETRKVRRSPSSDKVPAPLSPAPGPILRSSRTPPRTRGAWGKTGPPGSARFEACARWTLLGCVETPDLFRRPRDPEASRSQRAPPCVRPRSTDKGRFSQSGRARGWMQMRMLERCRSTKDALPRSTPAC